MQVGVRMRSALSFVDAVQVFLYGKRMKLKRFVAFVLLLTAGSVPFETVAGELRDGAVHHESLAAATSHSGFANGDHGHEDEGHSEPSSDHEHGSNSDHCTHPHGTSLPAAIAEVFLGTLAPIPPTQYTFSPRGWTPPAFVVPPRA